MNLIKKLHPLPRSPLENNLGWIKAPVDCITSISNDPREAVNQLNDDLLQSILVSLHCTTYDENHSHLNFDGRIFCHEDILIFASPVQEDSSKFSNPLFRISAQAIATSSLLPVYQWLKGLEFIAYPISLGTCQFIEHSSFDTDAIPYIFTLVRLNSLLLKKGECHAHIPLLKSLKIATSKIPKFLAEDCKFSTGYPLLIVELQKLLQIPDTVSCSNIIWDKSWDFRRFNLSQRNNI